MHSLSEQANQKTAGLVRELIGWLRQNKRWWLAPVVATLAAVGAMVTLGGTAIAPFIYTLF